MVPQPLQAEVSAGPETRNPHGGLSDRNGTLRPVWGILLFLLVMATTVALQALLLPRLIHLHTMHPFTLTPSNNLAIAIVAVAVTVATWVLARCEHRPFASYGLHGRNPLQHLLGGALAGVALLSALVLLLHQQDLLVFRGQTLFGAGLQWTLAMKAIGFYTLAAYAGDYLAHGYLQYTLTRGIAALFQRNSTHRSGVALGFWTAAVLLSVSVALCHHFTVGQTPLGLWNGALFGFLMAFSLWRTGSLWWAIGYHAAWDWSQSFLWGVPNSGVRMRDHLFLTEATGSPLQSGGSYGPESSIFTMGVLLAGFGILMLLHHRRVYPELWTESGKA